MNNHQLSTFRIAVAEDDETVRKMFVRLIQAIGHTVICDVGNGKDLIDRVPATDVDLIFADFDMPGMDGLELAEHFAGTGVPIVIISGHDESDRIVVKNEPVAMMLRKPITLDQLKEVIAHFTAARGR